MPYVLLALVSFLFLTFTVTRTRDLAGLVPAIAPIGSAMATLDLLAFSVLHLYSFNPRLLPDQGRDSILGFLLADCLFVPVTFGCLMVLFPRHRGWAAAGMVALILVVEVLFTRQGLFIPRLWSVWVSLLLFGILFGVGAWWVTHLERVGYGGWRRLLVIDAAMIYMWLLVAFSLGGLLSLWTARLHLVSDPMSDKVLGLYLLLGFPLSLVGTGAVWFRLTQTIAQAALFGAAWTAYLFSLKALGLYGEAPGWSPFYEGALAGAVVWATGLLDAKWIAFARARVR